MANTNNKGVALITGASAGIGATYADRLAGRGYGLLLVARDVARLEQLAVRLRGQFGVAVEVMGADLASAPDLRRVEDRLRQDDAITMLVNNAGIIVPGGLLEADRGKVETMLQLNVVAVAHLTAAAGAAFVKRRHGTIVNVGSVVALVPETYSGSYSATKAFVLALTQGLQAEAGPHGVRVQAVLPGATRTEILDRAGMDPTVFPDAMMMGVDELVDAALAGLDQGETVTIPSLPDPADWEALGAARAKLAPNLSHDHPASRYQTAHAKAA